MSKGFKVALVTILMLAVLVIGYTLSPVNYMGVPKGCINYYDGCNTCGKMEDGTWACTLMACPVDSYQKSIICTEYEKGYKPNKFSKYFYWE